MAERLADDPADTVAADCIADGTRGNGQPEARKALLIGQDDGLEEFLVNAPPTTIDTIELRRFAEASAGTEGEGPDRFSPGWAWRIAAAATRRLTRP